jgi:hypothetical protein
MILGQLFKAEQGSSRDQTANRAPAGGPPEPQVARPKLGNVSADGDDTPS